MEEQRFKSEQDRMRMQYDAVSHKQIYFIELCGLIALGCRSFTLNRGLRQGPETRADGRAKVQV